ncbi:radical SAM protein [Olleya sp. Bg11-27]|uniref:radical SAM protein n=1 Tax=Olleya sp. Bg11-27 TaxID=2058135 RepID=UPI0021CE94AF|nr:radical SAM protein [Olleya sp. Bg11-27]
MKIDNIVVKIASRCNINCKYCYMYNHEDLSYLKQPKFISEEVTTQFIDRLIENSRANDINQYSICLHGGEPMLMGKKRIKQFISHFDRLKEEEIAVQFSMQTNGILIDDEWCDLFKELNISVGISLDGPKEVNDIYRVDHNEKGTFDRVIDGINIMRKNKLPTGTLSVMNLHADPTEMYNHFINMKISFVDILFMDLTYDNFDRFVTPNIKHSMSDWYMQLFDLWFHNKEHTYFKFRLFDDFIGNILGGNTSADFVGTADKSILVLETNGDLEPVDSLKICGDSFTKRDYNVSKNKLSDLNNNDLILLYHKSGTFLPKKCLACPVKELCGGGYLTHRYSAKNGFNNPSVYCNDLLRLITHIQNKIVDEMPEDYRKSSNIQKLTYENALQIIEETLPTIEEPKYIEFLESFKKEEKEYV